MQIDTRKTIKPTKIENMIEDDTRKENNKDNMPETIEAKTVKPMYA